MTELERRLEEALQKLCEQYERCWRSDYFEGGFSECSKQRFRVFPDCL